MPIELFYVSVALMAGYQGAMLVNRAGRAQRPYAYMLIGDALLGAVAYLMTGREGLEQATGLVGAVSLGGCVCLMILPPFLRDLSRRLAAREYLNLAIRVAGLRELLSPGLGGRQEADVLRVVADVRAGRVDGALALLTTERARARSPEAQRALKDRIVTTLLYVSRWREAIEAYESEPHAATGAAVAAELVRAYGELGEMDRAALLVERLEQAPEANDPLHMLVMARARLLFLAFTGRVVGVAALISPRGPLAVLPSAARAYWLGTARLYAGDRAGARQTLAEAERAAGTEKRWRQLVRERLDSADNDTVEAPPTLSPASAALADHLAFLVDQAPAVALPVPVAAARGPVVTWSLIAANLAVFALATWLAGGDTADPRALARMGANIGKAVVAGEWWRLPASTLLHMGIAHLVINMVGLWSLGRMLEPVFGRVRFFALYVLAGLGGALLSTFGSKPAMSVGASGAVFGLLGAFLVDVLLSRRSGKPSPWRRDILGVLLFLTAANLAIGFLSPMIDQSAHVGGLVTGALVGLVLSRSGRIGQHAAAGVLAVVLAAAAAASLGYAVWGAATTTRLETIDRVGWERRTLKGVTLEIPRLWLWDGDDRITDATWRLSPTLTADTQPAREAGGVLDAVVADLRKEPSITDVAIDTPSISPPAGWSSFDVRFRFSDGQSSAEFHQLVFVRPRGDLAVVIGIVCPTNALAEAAPLVTRILESGDRLPP